MICLYNAHMALRKNGEDNFLHRCFINTLHKHSCYFYFRQFLAWFCLLNLHVLWPVVIFIDGCSWYSEKMLFSVSLLQSSTMTTRDEYVCTLSVMDFKKYFFWKALENKAKISYNLVLKLTLWFSTITEYI